MQKHFPLNREQMNAVLFYHTNLRVPHFPLLLDAVFWDCCSSWIAAVVPSKRTKAGFCDRLSKKNKTGGISGSLKAAEHGLSCFETSKKKKHNKEMKHKQLQNKAHFFFFFCESSSMSSQILNDMNVNVAAFPTALTDVNILGYKCCLQNVIRILTLCLIWCFCFQRFLGSEVKTH